MLQAIHCPSCSSALKLPENLSGQQVKCCKCQQAFTASPGTDVALMSDVVFCPACNAALKQPDHLPGPQVKCPKCEQAFQVAVDADSYPLEVEPVRRRDDDYDNEGYDDRSRRPRRPRRPRRRRMNAAAWVFWPALFMQIVSAITIVLVIGGSLIMIFDAISLLGAEPQKMQAGNIGYVVVQPPPTSQIIGFIIGRIIGVIIAVAWNAAIFSGAADMRNLADYSAAQRACYMGLIPCCSLFAFPFAIWGLIVLYHSDVKKAFR